MPEPGHRHEQRVILRCSGDEYDRTRHFVSTVVVDRLICRFVSVRYWMTRGSVDPEQVSGDTVGVVPLFDDVQGCEKFAQRVLSFGPGRSSEPGRGRPTTRSSTCSRAGARGSSERPACRSSPGVGVFVRHGTEWSVEARRGARDPLGPRFAIPTRRRVPGTPSSISAGEARRSATAARQFVLGVWAEAGCPSVTQFIGFVPPGRAPDHFHRYDEVLYILTGHGNAAHRR